MQETLCKIKQLVVAKKNMSLMSESDLHELESFSKILSKRNVCPQVTEKRVILNVGVSFVGLKQILTMLGYDAYEVEDIIDSYDKTQLDFVRDSKGKKTTYIEHKNIKRVIYEIIKGIDESEDTGNMIKTLNIIYQLILEKVSYIEKKQLVMETPYDKCINVIKKYNIYDGMLYGNQQYIIRKEICEILNENLSFSQCLRKLRIPYTWQHLEPYFKDNGKDWLVCKI